MTQKQQTMKQLSLHLQIQHVPKQLCIIYMKQTMLCCSYRSWAFFNSFSIIQILNQIKSLEYTQNIFLIYLLLFIFFREIMNQLFEWRINSKLYLTKGQDHKYGELFCIFVLFLEQILLRNQQSCILKKIQYVLKMIV